MAYGDKYGNALSSSMLATFMECPYKFKKLYVEKTVVDIPAAFNATTAGSIVHESIELGCSIWDTPTMTEMIPNAETKQHCRELFITMSNAIKDTNNYGMRFRTEPYSAPRMTNYWNKTYKALEGQLRSMEEYLSKEVAFDVPLFDIITTAARSMVNYYRLESQGEIPINGQKEVLLKATIKGVDVVGTLDWLSDDNTVMMDYKTGKGSYDISNNFQFGFYALLLKENFDSPPKEIKVAQLTKGYVDTFIVTDEYMNRIQLRLNSVLKLYNLYLEYGVWYAKDSVFGCPCQYAMKEAGEHRCPIINIGGE